MDVFFSSSISLRDLVDECSAFSEGSHEEFWIVLESIDGPQRGKFHGQVITFWYHLPISENYGGKPLLTVGIEDICANFQDAEDGEMSKESTSHPLLFQNATLSS